MSQFQKLRLRQRLLTHHIPLSVVSIVAVVALYITRPYRDFFSRASFATAYPALVLLSLTLLLGPWKVLRKMRNPVSDDFRRDVGIWAGVLGVLHTVVGQCVHLRGRPWLYYVYEPRSHHTFPLRHDLFGFANYTGAIGTLVLLALLATSNDYSLRAMGAPRWKRLQRWNYCVFTLVVLHAFAYQFTEKQRTPFVIVVSISVAITVTLQLIGLRSRRNGVIPRQNSIRPEISDNPHF